ncbi:RlmE family RNA methyltransferase [Candidatus Peregrinibacteria bacterium]|nr:RlmE family RNA methyltransferase [Candidatus Peregrinibacteria bacterium]
MPKAYSPQDHYFHLAKKRGFRARSAFKLEEILEKFPHLLPKKAKVIDLGSAPGSFLQVLLEKMRKHGKILGIDLQKIERFPGEIAEIHLLQRDIFSDIVAAEIQKVFPEKVDLITSDLAPNTMGVRDVDQWKSVELNQRVLELCKRFLKPGGNLITKIFVGEDFQEFWKGEFQRKFKKSRTFKPKACRDRSFETFLIGEGFQ